MANVKKGDLVRMEYTGKMSSTGQIFETTDETVAKKAGIYDETSLYGPRLAIFGSGAMIRGLEEAIISTPIGKKEEFTITPDKAFGGKRADFVRIVSEKEFHRQRVQPEPGMILDLDGGLATVKSVTSGRVVVDFNHPLAGESVSYTLHVVEIIADDLKKIDAILSSAGVQADVLQGAGGKGCTISFKDKKDKKKLEAAKHAILAAVPHATFSVS